MSHNRRDFDEENPPTHSHTHTHTRARVKERDNDNNDEYDDDNEFNEEEDEEEGAVEMKALLRERRRGPSATHSLTHSLHHSTQSSPLNIQEENSDNNHRNLHFHHLISRLQPSKLLYYDSLLSPTATRVVIMITVVIYSGIVLRYMYLRFINQPSDIVAYLMIHILLQMGIEMYCKISFMFLHGDKVLGYQRLQICFGWKSIFLFVALAMVCFITVHGTIEDFQNQYTSRSLEMMIIWRFFLAFFCWLMANDNTHQASLYYENFFIRDVDHCVYLSPTIDLTSYPKPGDTSSDGVIGVVGKSSQHEILRRIKLLMPTFVAFYRILTVKSIFNVINSAIFFILSIGFIGHSQESGMFYYNVYMIMVMSIISYTSFETITRFNTVMDLIESASSLKLHLHVRVSSYAVDDRFLTLTSGAALLQVVLKSLGVS